MVATPHSGGKQSESKREDKSCEELSARPGQVSLEPFEQRSSRRVRRSRPKKRTVTGRAETGFIYNGRHVRNREMWQFTCAPFWWRDLLPFPEPRRPTKVGILPDIPMRRGLLLLIEPPEREARNENRSGSPAVRECAPSVLWRHRKGCLVLDGRTCRTGTRRDPVCQRRLRDFCSPDSHVPPRLTARRELRRPARVSLSDVGECRGTGRRVRHSAFSRRLSAFSVFEALCRSAPNNAARPPEYLGACTPTPSLPQ